MATRPDQHVIFVHMDDDGRTRRSPIILEATAEGETEHTRIPLGPRKSAAPVVIPSTAATQCQT